MAESSMVDTAALFSQICFGINKSITIYYKNNYILIRLLWVPYLSHKSFKFHTKGFELLHELFAFLLGCLALTYDNSFMLVIITVINRLLDQRWRDFILIRRQKPVDTIAVLRQRNNCPAVLVKNFRRRFFRQIFKHLVHAWWIHSAIDTSTRNRGTTQKKRDKDV